MENFGEYVAAGVGAAGAGAGGGCGVNEPSSGGSCDIHHASATIMSQDGYGDHHASATIINLDGASARLSVRICPSAWLCECAIVRWVLSAFVVVVCVLCECVKISHRTSTRAN